MTDSKPVTQFFRTEMILLALWNACFFVLHFKITIVHIPGKMNTSAAFLSSLEAGPNEKIFSELAKVFLYNLLKSISNRQKKHKKTKSFFHTNDAELLFEEKVWQSKKERLHK